MMEPAKKKQAGFVGESLGGFIFSDFMPAFDAMLAAAKLAEFLSREKIKLSEVLREFPVIFRQQLELECSIEQKALIMRRAMELESGSDKKELIDGIKFWHQEAWALVLPDAMRPVLHIYAEAGTQKETQLILERYVNIINKIKQGGAR
jgi:mannose-1-phosphate guanylyltransferase/phosphomannomutase